ncbi:MAG: glycoside hydrolase family 43 protein [Acidobacteria bacterium]|nr:glycoside hydrolase family 43 protein [Acidobacteriota bacterium]
MLCVSSALAADPLVFSFFRNNGEDGLYLATSDDGLKWRALNNDKPLLKPVVGESKLMRDPSILRGPDGTFHMVWTTSWQGKTIGYSSSRDLKIWSPQRAIEVFAGTDAPENDILNCWAPELFYDKPSMQFTIIWATTIRGRFPKTLGTASRENNHRIYEVRTKDFQTFTPAKLYYDPAFVVIDAAIFPHGRGYAMVVKNETQTPQPAKNLFLTFADSLNGPWTPPTAKVTGDYWAEGPAPIQIGNAWYIYFDKYRDHKYGAVRSTDLKNWEDISGQIDFPKGTRHGTAFRAPKKIVDGLR